MNRFAESGKQCFALKKYMQNKPYELLEVC
jgi:hypothetical protein